MNHPYETFEADPLWPVVNNAISDLVENGDLSEHTGREYIVGHLVKNIRDSVEVGTSGSA